MNRTLMPEIIFLFSVSSIFAKAPSQLQKPFSKVELLAMLQADQTETNPPAENPTKETRAGGKVLPPKLIHAVAPVYPKEARSLGIEDTVRFAAVIGKDGKLHDIKLVSGDPMLVKSAMKAVSQWRYSPALLNGKPVEMRSEVVVKFKARYGMH
jgi:TonB family protein